jgi:uncharacterized protein YndB with AHSA1/START domain
MKKSTLLKVLVILILALAVFFFAALKIGTTTHVVHVFNAPVDKVWQIWTDAEMMKKWWSPKDFTAPVIKSDFRVGGSFLLSMRDPNGKMFWNAGRYTEIIQNQKIVSAMAFSDENGNVVPASTYGIPGEWPEIVHITVEFKDFGDKTQVTVDETGIPLIMSVFSKMGWGQQFDKFDELLN